LNKQIAHQLHISEWTVATHLRRIFAKLGVDTRAAMVYRCAFLIGGQPAPTGIVEPKNWATTKGKNFVQADHPLQNKPDTWFTLFIT
jgi:hypothetical protein